MYLLNRILTDKSYKNKKNIGLELNDVNVWQATREAEAYQFLVTFSPKDDELKTQSRLRCLHYTTSMDWKKNIARCKLHRVKKYLR